MPGRRTFGRRDVDYFVKIRESVSNIFFDCDGGGMMFGSWIDEQGRNNGYDEDDVIDNPAYIVESILRDFLNVPNNQIKHTAFDAAGNSTNGNLDGWSFAGGIYEIINSRDILDNILLQCKSQLYRDPAGRFDFIVRDTIDYTRHGITGDNLVANHSFETAGAGPGDGSGDVFGSWTETNNNNTTRKILQSSAKASDNSNSCFFDANANDGTTDFTVSQTGISLSANTPYRFKFDYWFDARTQGTLQFYIYDNDNAVDLIVATTLNGLTTEWKTITVDFTVGTATTDAQIFIGSYNETTGDLYVDNVRLYEVKQYYLFDKDSNIGSLEISESSHDDLVNEVRINYWLDRGSGEFGKMAFISSQKKLSGAYLTEALDTTEITFDVTDHTVFSDDDFIMIDREVMQINGAPAAGQIVVNDTAGNRDAERNSKNTTHLNGAPIYIITEDSDDGNGSTADTTREGEATEAIWKYNAQNTLEIDADWIVEATTAVNLRNYYHDQNNEPHYIIEFDAFLDASELQLGSIIRFDDSVMDSYLKMGGESWSGVNLRVTKISRSGFLNYHIVAEEMI